VYRSLDELNGRVASRVRSLLEPDETFVLAVRATDGLFDRWSTHVAVTTRRLLTVRVVLLESSVTGVRFDRLDDVTLDEPAATVQVTHGLETNEYAFDSAETAAALADTITEQRTATAAQ